MSPSRLRTYRSGPGEAGSQLIGRYLWNAALAESLHPALHFLEVGLRNRLDAAIGGIAGPDWIQDPKVIIDERSRLHVVEVCKRIEDDGAAADRDRIIAGVDFGFWSALFKRQYEVGPDRPRQQIPLWPRIARAIVPAGHPSLRVRAALDDRVGGIRILRNRVYHHEPIWSGRPNRRGARVPLSRDYAAMVELIGAISPTLREALRLVDRFGDVYDPGPGPWAAAVVKFCDEQGYAA